MGCLPNTRRHRRVVSDSQRRVILQGHVGGLKVSAVRCAYGFHTLHLRGRTSETLSHVDSGVFDVLVVGVAAALRSAVAAKKGVLARREEGGGARGEKLVRAGPERPIYATLCTERARVPTGYFGPLPQALAAATP